MDDLRPAGKLQEATAVTFNDGVDIDGKDAAAGFFVGEGVEDQSRQVVLHLVDKSL